MTASNLTPHPALYGRMLDDGRLQCGLCPRECKLHPGQHGACLVRGRVGDQLVLHAYGRASGLCVDPIEKKPLYHFHPGSDVLSFGTVGCNLACKFCQNWGLSKAKDLSRMVASATPQAVALAAQHAGCRSVAFTYNEPVIFAEYAMDVADACHALGIATVAVTAGYIQPPAREEFFARIDAANVDLKSFREDFYYRLTGAHLQPVLDTLRYLRHHTSVWLEITTLLIPGYNDSPAEVTELCRWIAGELGTDVPLHWSAFHPNHRLRDIAPTPRDTLERCHDIALSQGLSFVYQGNVRGGRGHTTHCPRCDAELLVREGFAVVRNAVAADGTCPHCGQKLPGRFL
ncbi:AmmeMemoRadiSam system radical SAM enzyme [Candidatus Symbiobacter mobilis]|nr:AmmeMemoRadiSam system radical SAM enzyme [Candidatus Symbiobacter mobilis]